MPREERREKTRVDEVSLETEQAQEVIKEFQKHPTDTGSTEVQIALLTRQILELAGHLQAHRKDNQARRGLLGQVARRRRLLVYLAREDAVSYRALLARLGLPR